MLIGLEKNMHRGLSVRVENIEMVRKNGTDPQRSEQIAVARALTSTKYASILPKISMNIHASFSNECFLY